MSEQKKVPQISYVLNLFTDYYQIYLRDDQLEDDTPDDWGEQLTAQMIAVAPGIIGVSTARNTYVPVHVALFDSRPDDDFTHWDHVVEASIDVPSGQLVIAGCSEKYSHCVMALQECGVGLEEKECFKALCNL